MKSSMKTLPKNSGSAYAEPSWDSFGAPTRTENKGNKRKTEPLTQVLRDQDREK